MGGILNDKLYQNIKIDFGLLGRKTTQLTSLWNHGNVFRSDITTKLQEKGIRVHPCLPLFNYNNHTYTICTELELIN